MDVISIYDSVLPLLSTMPATITNTLEYRRWAERLLTRSCLIEHRRSQRKFRAGQGSIDIEQLLVPFRTWAKLWDGKSGQGLVPGNTSGIDSSSHRREVWKDYYHTLSEVLQQGHVYAHQHAPNSSTQSGARMLQIAELRNVETTYEALLLQEVSFPRADEVNYEVDEWVDQVMSNWSIICGPTWHDEDLGQGGQESASRGVLDVRYHSIGILCYGIESNANCRLGTV